MKYCTSQFISLFTLVFFTCSAFASELSSGSLYNLMHLSGINNQTKEIPNLILSGINEARKQDNTPISDELAEDLQKSIIRSFQVSEFLDIIGNEIKQTITEQDAKKLLKWFRSDFGKKITLAEEESSKPEAYQEMLAQSESLLADEKRVKLAIKMDNLLNATQMTLNIQNNISISTFIAISTAMNPSQPIATEEFKKQLAAQEAQMRQNVNQLIILSFVYSYKDLDIPSIEKYINFLETPTAAKFNQTVVNGMEIAFTNSANKLAKHLAENIKKQMHDSSI